MSDVKTRVKSVLIIGPIFLFAAYLGGWIFLVAVTVVSLRALGELQGMAPQSEWREKGSLPSFAAVVVILLSVHLSYYSILVYVAPVFMLFYLSFGLAYGVSWSRQVGLMAWNMFIVAYVSLTAFWLAVRTVPAGWHYLFFGLLITWVNDAAAYFVGSAWGRRRLVPRLSPNKTYVGAAGGMLAAAAVGIGAGAFFPVSSVMTGAAGVALAAAAQLGDLFASLLKRGAELKDSSDLIPGHGGVVDRIDSLLFSLAAMYALITAGVL